VTTTGYTPRGMNPVIVVGILFGIGAVLLLIGVFVYPPVHEMPAAFDWTSSSAVLVALLGIHALLLRGQDRLLARLLLLCFFLVPTALALSVGGTMTLSGLLDPADPSEHLARVLGAYRVRSTTGPGPSSPYAPIKTVT